MFNNLKSHLDKHHKAYSFILLVLIVALVALVLLKMNIMDTSIGEQLRGKFFFDEDGNRFL